MSSKSDNKLSRTLYPEAILFKLNYTYCVGEDQILNNKVVSIIVVCLFFPWIHLLTRVFQGIIYEGQNQWYKFSYSVVCSVK